MRLLRWHGSSAVEQFVIHVTQAAGGAGVGSVSEDEPSESRRSER